MRFAGYTLLLAVLFWLPAPAEAQEGYATMDALRLGPGDALRLEVRDEPGLAGDFAIDGDGRALLPLVGLVDVAGRPFADVRREVLEAYGRELARPEVRVIPLLRIPVLGEVQRPGLVSVDPTFSLADVIATAGGLTPTADRNDISLLRGGAAVVTTTAEGLTSVGTPILSGDQVFVGRRGWISDNLTVLVGAGASVLGALVTALVLR